MNVAVPVDLAIWINAAALSRTWVTDPGALVRSERKMVWMESTTITAGSSSWTVRMMDSTSVSANSRKLSEATPMRSARIFTCEGDSSPVTYSSFVSESRVANSVINVDFPMPGSPAIRTTDPSTIPPPSTRSSSTLSVRIRRSLPLWMSFNLRGRVEVAPEPTSPGLCFVEEDRSSTMEFHAPHAGHCPNQRGDSLPQS